MKVTNILGFKNREIRVDSEMHFDSDEIFILYPGFNYGVNSPKFYYLLKLLTERKKNFIFFNLNWNQLNSISELPFSEAQQIMIEEIKQTFNFIQQFKNKKITIIAKSLGTLAIEISKKNELMDKMIEKYIWLTPFSNKENLKKLCLNKDIIYVGTKDNFYDEILYKSLKSECRVYENLNHSLEDPVDVLKSTKYLKIVLDDIVTDLKL